MATAANARTRAPKEDAPAQQPKPAANDNPFKGMNVLQRINWVQQQVSYVQKEKKEGMRYTIVSHDAVTALVRPHMVAAGVWYGPVDLKRSQDGNRTEAEMVIRFANIDDPNDFIEVSSMGYGVDKEDKGPGKAISYAVKYALLKVLGLETGDDPDETQGKAAEHRSSAAQRAEQIENALASCTTAADALAIINAPSTQEVMTALQKRDLGEYQRVRAVMSSELRRCKESDAADQRPPEEREPQPSTDRIPTEPGEIGDRR